MASLLVVTHDSEAVTKLNAIAASTEYRVRNVLSVETAREWLGMQKFDVVLVDGRLADGIPLGLLEHAWRHHSYMIGGLFNFQGEVPDEWAARLSGARVFAGPKAELSIRQMLENRPNWDSDGRLNGILLVEDLDSPRDIICSYIEVMGFSPVIGAASAMEALEILRRDHNRFFSVVTDFNMPKMSGLDLIRTIRCDDVLHHLPVMVLTAYATAENLVDCIKAGASGFIVKPPKKAQLLAELEKAKRIVLTKDSPRLCDPEDALNFEKAVASLFQR